MHTSAHTRRAGTGGSWRQGSQGSQGPPWWHERTAKSPGEPCGAGGACVAIGAAGGACIVEIVVAVLAATLRVQHQVRVRRRSRLIFLWERDGLHRVATKKAILFSPPIGRREARTKLSALHTCSCRALYIGITNQALLHVSEIFQVRVTSAVYRFRLRLTYANCQRSLLSARQQALTSQFTCSHLAPTVRAQEPAPF